MKSANKYGKNGFQFSVPEPIFSMVIKSLVIVKLTGHHQYLFICHVLFVKRERKLLSGEENYYKQKGSLKKRLPRKDYQILKVNSKSP